MFTRTFRFYIFENLNYCGKMEDQESYIQHKQELKVFVQCGFYEAYNETEPLRPPISVNKQLRRFCNAKGKHNSALSALPGLALADMKIRGETSGVEWNRVYYYP